MSNELLSFTVADLVGAATLFLFSRGGARYAWGWSIAAWVATAAVSIGLIPLGTIVPIAAMAFVIGVGLLTPVVGLIAVLTLLSSPILVAVQAWGWWRRRRGVATRIFQA
jgi:hypothetical protein